MQEAMNVKTDGLFLMVLGPSGAGKSHFIGTYPGKTLFLYGSGESHGPSSAIKNNKDLVAIPWNRAKNAKGEMEELGPNTLFKRLNDLLDPKALVAAGIKCVALDSITNLCIDIKKTDLFKQRCLTAQGKHNPFKETDTMVDLLSNVVKKLQILSDYHNIDSITTMDLQIQNVGSNGEIIDSKPGLPTFGVGKAIIQQYPDILVLSRLGEKRVPTFQNFATVTNKSKDMESNEIVKYIEYNPRVRGVNELPETIEASVPTLLKLKDK